MKYTGDPLEVGDLVTGKIGNGYAVTDSNSLLEIISIKENKERMLVKVLKSTKNLPRDVVEGRNYEVSVPFFRHVNSEDLLRFN